MPSCCRRARERGAPTGFLEETEDIRDGDWQVPPPRPDYENRRAEITGPTDRKLVINALNSGAKGFMADFEDANSPTWRNQVEGHLNLIDAIEGTITYDGADGRHYELIDNPATLLVRPRGWHLPEKHLTIGGEPVAGAFMDFGLYAFHCGKRLAERDRGLYLYLPKMEHWQEAALWNDVFTFTREALVAPGRADPRDGADRDAARPPSRWPRSSTRSASTPTGSTPAAGTTSSR